MIIRLCGCAAAGLVVGVAVLVVGFRLADFADFNLHHF